MAGDESDMGFEIELAVFLEHARDGEAHRHQRRLRILGEGQIALRPLEHEAREILLQRLVDLVEDIARRRERAGKIAPHADRLRTLARKYQGARHAAFQSLISCNAGDQKMFDQLIWT